MYKELYQDYLDEVPPGEEPKEFDEWWDDYVCSCEGE
jgi:hypothetical protein